MFSPLLIDAYLNVVQAAVTYGLVHKNTSLSREISPLTAAVSVLALNVIIKCVNHQLAPPPMPRGLDKESQQTHQMYWHGKRLILITALNFSMLIMRMSPTKALLIMGLHKCVNCCVMGSVYVGNYFLHTTR